MGLLGAKRSDFINLDQPDTADQQPVAQDAKPGSHERNIEKSAPETEEISVYQREELQRNFSVLFREILADLENLDELGQNIMTEAEAAENDNQALFLGKLINDHLILPNWQAAIDHDMSISPEQRIEEHKAKEAKAELKKAGNTASPLTEDEIRKKMAQAYTWVLDVPQPFVAGDRDAYNEYMNDRAQENPLAGQIKEAQRLRRTIQRIRQEYPEKKLPRVKSSFAKDTPRHTERHANILPPPNPQLEGDLSKELE